MSATFTVSGSNLTIAFSYTGTITRINDIANNAARQLHTVAGLGPQDVPFESLTNTQKLAIRDTFISQSFANLAKQYYVTASTEAARSAAADTNMSLP